MDKVIEHLSDWVQRFLENRNLFQKNIIGMKPEGERLIVTYKDKEIIFLIMPMLDVERFEKEAEKEKHYSVVCLNTKDNLKAMISGWKKLIGYRFLSIYFINPFADGDTKWVIRPQVHDRITEPESLELGLGSLFEGVAETTLEHVKGKIS